ncbi:hypothetical protein GCM10010201_27900 [Pilimelia columellifera subsp. columellifera]|uniref:Uncharacterized protein n=1 Tax=Pilimelia columellifera subsp. columellifera TaxID=706583 RepID=A0ABN3NMK9_9ACTN
MPRSPVTRAGGGARRWAVAGTLALALALTGVAGCSSENASCDLNACTVTFDGVNATASVLGVEAKVVSVQGEQVTLEVAGAQQTLTVGQQAVDIAGLKATLESADTDKIVVRLAR